MQGQYARPAHADIDLMRLFGGLQPRGFEQFSAKGLLTSVHSADSLANGLEQLAESMLGHIRALRQEYTTDPKLRKSVKGVPGINSYPHGTRELFRELVSTLLVDSGLPLTHQHAIDLLHSVVPLAYCDFVLLDAHWEAQVTRVRRKLTDAGFEFPMAKVYSERRGGIARFLAALAQE